MRWRRLSQSEHRHAGPPRPPPRPEIAPYSSCGCSQHSAVCFRVIRSRPPPAPPPFPSFPLLHFDYVWNDSGKAPPIFWRASHTRLGAGHAWFIGFHVYAKMVRVQVLIWKQSQCLQVFSTSANSELLRQYRVKINIMRVGILFISLPVG